MAHQHSIDTLTAVWLLPVVAPIVAAATGANLCSVLPPSSSNIHAVLIMSFVLWGIGVPFAMSILVLYIHRLTVYHVHHYKVSLNCSYRRMKSSLAHFFQLVLSVKVERG